MSALRESTVNRISAGTAGAGRYTFKTNSESDLELETEYDFYAEGDSDEDTDGYGEYDSESDADHETDGRSSDNTDTGTKVSLSGLIDDAELAEVRKTVYAVARYKAANLSHLGTAKVDPEDAAQEAMIKLLIQKSRDSEVSAMGLGVRLAEIEIGNQSYSHLGNRNRDAFAKLNQRVHEVEDYLQRELSPREYDAMAEEIRENWRWTNSFSDSPTSIPAKGFQHHGELRNNVSINVEYDGESADEYYELSTEGNYNLSDRGENGHWFNRAADIADGADDGVSRPKGSRSLPKTQAKKYAWNGIAELSGLPVVEENSLSNNRIKKVRKDMNMKPGRVAEVIREWEAGIRNLSTEALFAPFGATTPVECALIADKLTEHHYKLKKIDKYLSDVLWESAASCAGRRSAGS